MIDTGTDMMLLDGELVAAADGDAQLVSGLDCLVQDIRHEAMTYPGDLFYDPDYGYGLQDFIQAPSTELSRLELTERIKRRLRTNDSIEAATVTAAVDAWDLNAIRILAGFRALGVDVTLTISVTADRVTVEVVSG